MSRPLAVICLAAGMGKRTKVSMPKVLLPLCGRTLAESALLAAAELKPDRTVVVLHNQRERVQASLEAALGDRFPSLVFVDQGSPKGTGHAVQVGMEPLQGFVGDVIVIYGDCPLMTAETLGELRELRGDAACSALTAYPDDPTGLGRILRDDDGRFVGIREQKDCTEEEAAIDEVNCGFYCFDSEKLRGALANLKPNNAQGEYYLTDVIADFVAQGEVLPTLEARDEAEVQGVNSLADLSLVQSIMQERILLRHLNNGVLIVDPAATWIDDDVEIGSDTKILPGTVIGKGCRVGKGCEIGPFAHLRGGTVLEDGAALGNFVEAKNAHLHQGAKAKHLTYLGDAEVGAKANIGCGTITANYDGVNKHRTAIGAGAFIGSGTVLCAPVTVGDQAMTAAGAIVKPGTEIKARELWLGVPARYLRQRDPKPGLAAPSNGDQEA
ncbi:MAG: bifunctional N-acetylglucosamine-1-phosphate uridyltransferase/glucosamine-1-phosphate acetyltransferase [Planctomycetes bacterium]|nr:bifunctional N-acetylglucosamine-1-phosphate uridyltransferase/glucosamine-1-phosphate acetyltransferase [Planctomycetota bacterium]